MRFAFHPQALEEYEEAARYYARCQEGLELRFIDCVEAAIPKPPRLQLVGRFSNKMCDDAWSGAATGVKR
jgi:hypothetical protein